MINRCIDSRREIASRGVPFIDAHKFAKMTNNMMPVHGHWLPKAVLALAFTPGIVRK
jgi:hypothetical protein